MSEASPQTGILRAAGIGLLAGILMAMLAMATTAAMGMGLLAPLAMIGGIILGPAAAMGGGAAVLFAGLMLHMALSMMFGVLFAVAVRYVAGPVLLLGAAYGIALWLVNFYLLASLLPGAHSMAAHEPLLLAVGSHVVFGLVVGAIIKRPDVTPR